MVTNITSPVVFKSTHRGLSCHKCNKKFCHHKILSNCQIKSYQGAYIKYVGGRAGGFYKFFQKIFVAQETIELNISWPSNFFRKYFMAPPINFSFSFKAYLQQYFRVVLTVIFKFQITKEVNIHNNIQKIIFK